MERATTTPTSQPDHCEAPNCARTDIARLGERKLCRRHARQVRLHGALTPEREHVLGREGCSVPGCAARHRAKGFCGRHYEQLRWQEIKRTLALLAERWRA